MRLLQATQGGLKQTSEMNIRGYLHTSQMRGQTEDSQMGAARGWGQMGLWGAARWEQGSNGGREWGQMGAGQEWAGWELGMGASI